VTMVAQSFANPNGLLQGLAARPPLAIAGAEDGRIVQGDGGGDVQAGDGRGDTGRFAGPGTKDDREADEGGGASVAGRLCEPEKSLATTPRRDDGGGECVSLLPPLPAHVRWLAGAEGAKRLRITGRAARMKYEAWAMASSPLAVRLARPGGVQWYIRSDAHPALRDIPLPADIPVELGNLTEMQRRDLGQRRAILAEWQEAKREAVRACVPNGERLTGEDATRLFLAKLKAERGIELSARTLRAWYRRSRGAKGAGGLIDGRWLKASKTPDDDPFLAEVRAMYMGPGGLSSRYCAKLTRTKAREKGWRIWSDRKVTKYLAAIPLAERVFARKGEKAYVDETESYINRDWTPVRSNEQWNSDHHKLDLWVRTGEKVNTATGEVTYKHERPWITVWQDNASRKIVGYDLYVGDPSTDNIILAFRRAVIAHGVPESVWVDNGKDYDSFALHGRTKKERRQRRGNVDRELIFGIFALMNVKAHNVQKYHGQSKLSERYFGTMEGQFCRLFPDAYCGNKPDARPEGLTKRLAAGKAPTLAELREAFGQWVENVYNAGEHTGDGMNGKSPNQVFTEKFTTNKRTATNDHLNVLLLKHTKPVKVTQNGVRCNGFFYGQHSETLRRMMGAKVVIAFDPEQPATVAVLTLAGKLVCGIESNERLPGNATGAMMQAAKKAKGHARKVELAYRGARLTLQETPLEIMYRMAAEKRKEESRREDDPTPGPGIRPIRSPFEDQLPAIQKALKAPVMKVAAGAEGLDLLALANAELDLPTRPARRDSFSLVTALNDTSTDGPGGGSSDGD
jgi:putative transposase